MPERRFRPRFDVLCPARMSSSDSMGASACIQSEAAPPSHSTVARAMAVSLSTRAARVVRQQPAQPHIGIQDHASPTICPRTDPTRTGTRVVVLGAAPAPMALSTRTAWPARADELSQHSGCRRGARRRDGCTHRQRRHRTRGRRRRPRPHRGSRRARARSSNRGRSRRRAEAVACCATGRRRGSWGPFEPGSGLYRVVAPQWVVRTARTYTTRALSLSAVLRRDWSESRRPFASRAG